MIRNKSDLHEFLECDKRQLGITRRSPRPFVDHIWKYEIILRKYEYWINQKSVIARIMRVWYKFLFYQYSVKTGIFIGPNTCGKGLCITHMGMIQINWHSHIGENLRIQEGVTVGAGKDGAPQIGNNVYLCSGSKIIGNIRIPDNCVVGANAVVIRDIEEEGVTVGGVPAKKISNNDSSLYIR